MAKIDEIKEFIGFLKAIFITLILIETSLIAWVFKNFETESGLRLLIVNAVLVIIALAVGFLFKLIIREIKRLKEL